VQEGGRTLVEMIARELAQTTAGYKRYANNQNYIVNFRAELPGPASPLIQPLPGPANLANGDLNARTNLLQSLFFLQKENLKWTGIGYVVRVSDGAGNLALTDTVGALYRFEASMSDRDFHADPGRLWRDFSAAVATESRMNKIVNGVVHFKVRTYGRDGVWQRDDLPNNSLANLKSDIRLSGFESLPMIAGGEVALAAFYSNALPAFVELELGILESRTAQRANAMLDATTRRTYLENQAAHVHVFRTRVPIRNVDPEAYQ
jgi:hypothetical protein